MFVLRALVVLLLAFVLTGCIQSEAGIRYMSQTRGEIVQTIRLGDRLDPSEPTTRQWLQALEQRSRQLGGRTDRSDPQVLKVTIPFNNGGDLQTKFNAFFNTVSADEDTEPTAAETLPTNLPQLAASLQVTERNWLVVQRNHLALDLDLRPLGLRSPTGNVIVRPRNLLDLKFRLTTPWGGKSEESDSAAELVSEGKQLLWTLQPGAVNHLEATFLVPSVLGVGTVAIALLVSVGAALRAFLFANPNRSR